MGRQGSMGYGGGGRVLWGGADLGLPVGGLAAAAAVAAGRVLGLHLEHRREAPPGVVRVEEARPVGDALGGLGVDEEVPLDDVDAPPVAFQVHPDAHLPPAPTPASPHQNLPRRILTCPAPARLASCESASCRPPPPPCATPLAHAPPARLRVGVCRRVVCAWCASVRASACERACMRVNACVRARECVCACACVNAMTSCLRACVRVRARVCGWVRACVRMNACGRAAGGRAGGRVRARE